ncbi:TetR/AcrR family transcriptional regulator [Metabacillus rhizolycopersici]|uniref:TetR/AcrR family transcriptional regulator n=1 Tax=Metabacillus rhizolycopersici TaxID=2875709 RepID=A0ABS7UWV3_9BACI|nr:TetR/AcrR family transcriptional regulator [Metabacillus rhizolycopersici]MBZ5752719.1 TetR/AcrR family transcriptional regulator [Metabacillus rhizolycopersici]
MARERKFSLEDLFQTTKQLLLDYGYEGFTFSLLADQLHVARGTLYKYYENKDELISAYMVYELKQVLLKLKQIGQIESFESQFDFLITLIFSHNDLQHFIAIAHQIPKETNEKVKANKEQLEKLHLDMYSLLQDFIALGREEKVLKDTIPDGLILGFIFQTVAIPNHFGVPHKEWVESIKHIISHGMFTNN